MLEFVLLQFKLVVVVVVVVVVFVVSYSFILFQPAFLCGMTLIIRKTGLKTELIMCGFLNELTLTRANLFKTN